MIVDDIDDADVDDVGIDVDNTDAGIGVDDRCRWCRCTCMRAGW